MKEKLPQDGAVAGADGFMRPPRSFPAEEFAQRLERFRAALAHKGLDGAIVTRPVSRLYLTGFQSSAGTLLVSAEKGALFTVDFRYVIMARREMPFVKCQAVKGDGDSATLAFAKSWKKIGYEGLTSRAATERLFSKIKTADSWQEIDDMLSELRAVKSPREQKALRAAIAQGDALYAWVLPQIRPGMSEWQIRNLFRIGADRFGHGESFDTIVCAGKFGAECHHRPGDAILRRGSSLLMDFGVVLDGYHYDMTRCVSFGAPSPLYKKVYSIVLKANREAIARLRPGMTGAEVDAIARRIIEKAGYGEAFGHSLGHSVGLEIHEGPNFSTKEKRVIKPGMVITVEPGIYLPNRLGVRIEDVVLVTRNGCEVLTKSPKELTVL